MINEMELYSLKFVSIYNTAWIIPKSNNSGKNGLSCRENDR